MVSVIASSEICSWFEPQSGKAKDQAHSYMLVFLVFNNKPGNMFFPIIVKHTRQ
jgi:hypothetical protein